MKLGDEILATTRIRGFHCTRLLSYEAESVRQEGLKLPSPEFLRERIERATRRGDIQRALADALIANNQAGEPNRRDMIAFVHGSSLLRQSGVRPFFESWGCEALFSSLESDPQIGPALKKLGEPFVVCAALPASELQVSSLAKHFIDVFLSVVSARTSAGFESQVKRPVPPAWLVHVIGSTDFRFSFLTGPPE